MPVAYRHGWSTTRRVVTCHQIEPAADTLRLANRHAGKIAAPGLWVAAPRRAARWPGVYRV